MRRLVHESDDQSRELEIDPARPRRLMGLVSYLLLFAVVAGALMLVFLKFTSSIALAVGLVLFMVAYICVMSWLASRKIERRGEHR